MGAASKTPCCNWEPSWRWLCRRPRCSLRAAPVCAWRSLLWLGLFQGIVQLFQRLFNPQGGEAGRGALVPALLHDLCQRRQNLGEAQKGGRIEEFHGEKRSGSDWEEGGPPGTHRIGEEAVGDHGGLLVDAHHLLHVLEAGVAGDGVEEGRPVLLHDACGRGWWWREDSGGVCRVHPKPCTSWGARGGQHDRCGPCLRGDVEPWELPA